MDYSNLFVCLMGICTVFIGLICIIVLVSAMSAVVRATDKALAQPAPAVTAVPAAPGDQVSPAMVAAVSAAIAEEMGTDISAIRIISFKKV